MGGFLSLLYNPSAKDQLRWIASLREDHYQIPNPQDAQAAGIRDLDLEQDYLAGFHWTHSFADGVTFTLAPYYHYNSAHYVGGPQDNPFVLNDNARSNYFGGRSVLQAQKKRHNARAGIEVWGQHDNTFFGLTANPGGNVLNQAETHWANSNALFLEDQYEVTSWLKLDLGIRFTHYAGLRNENAADPRLGAAIRIPRLNWTLHGYYAYYYQPPPLDSLAGPALNFAVAQGFGFIPLPGERDIQHDIGLSIPVRGWSLDVDNFHTSARNFLDHDVIGDSGIFIPLTDLGAIISGTEVTLRSPRLFHMAQWRVAYSNQIGQGIGPITGGLLEDAPAGNFLLDHDQRNTVTSVLSLTLPGHMWATPAYQFGSGFLNGDGPSHLPPHSTFDLSIGKTFRGGRDRFRKRGQHRQYPLPAGHQQYFRRDTLHQPSPDLWRSQVPVSLLRRLTLPGRGGHRPMRVPKLPAAVPMFRNPREETVLLDALPFGAHLDLAERHGHHREIRCERVYSQIVSPSQVDLLDGAREILNSSRRGSAIRKHQAAFRGHEERGGVGEMPAPSRRTLLRDVMSHRLGEGSHTLVDRRRTLRCHRLRLDGRTVA